MKKVLQSKISIRKFTSKKFGSFGKNRGVFIGLHEG